GLAPRAADRGRRRAPGAGLDLVRPRLLDVARAVVLRAGAPVARLAPRRARLLLRDRHAVLAAVDSFVAGPSALAPMDDDPVPAARGCAEYGARGNPDVFRPPRLPRIR